MLGHHMYAYEMGLTFVYYLFYLFILFNDRKILGHFIIHDLLNDLCIFYVYKNS